VGIAIIRPYIIGSHFPTLGTGRILHPGAR
jgi:hypothetical protein